MNRPIALPKTAEIRDTFWRTLLTFNATRVVIAIVLLIYLLLSNRKSINVIHHHIYWQSCIAYLVLSNGFFLLAVYHRRRFLWQLLSQIAVDLVIISILYVTAGGAKSGLAILYLFPLAGGAILAPMIPALFFVALTALFLLAETAYSAIIVGVAEPAFSQAGLYGAAFFASVFVINRLAARLIRQEELAIQRGIDLEMQQAINRLVIADMGDGILVLGRNGEILTVNPAAERMLGLLVPYKKARYKLSDLPYLAPIADAFFAWAGLPAEKMLEQQHATAFVVIKLSDDPLLVETAGARLRRELATHIKLRFAMVAIEDLAEDKAVIFLQDVSEIENQAQQLKLASMGRLTASIAHEVRNPLSSISYAASLLREEELNSTQTRLLDIVGDNVARLNRMIEDILKLSRKAQTHNEPLALAPFFSEILREFKETNALPDDMIEVGDMSLYCVWFDPLHLREVILNLLTNALRYASGSAGSIRIHALADISNRLELHVQDDGVPIKPEVRAHLFEPFYTTSSKGTGLGLYLARELCLNNGAMIDYEYRTDLSAEHYGESSGRFVITAAVAQAS
jgi:two-component system sensor histidine kinase PilS (NtrC family)